MFSELKALSYCLPGDLDNFIKSHKTATNAIAAKGASSCGRHGLKAHGGARNHSIFPPPGLPQDLCVGKEEVSLFHLRIFPSFLLFRSQLEKDTP